MRVTTVSGMKTSLQHLIGAGALLSSEEDAAVRSFNRFGKLAWDRARWPFNCVLKQIIPDVRVRSVNVGSGGSGYVSGAPTVTVAGSATATATLNSDDEVNGIAVTAAGSGYTEAPAVTIAAPPSGTTATATATIIAVIDMGTTMDTVFRITTTDPYTTVTKALGFRIDAETGASEYGLAVIENHSSTAPLWVHYRTPFNTYGGSATDYPDIFSEYAVQGAYSNWLQSDGQTSKAQAALQEAEAILATELDRLERQQGQQDDVLINTYGTTAPQPA